MPSIPLVSESKAHEAPTASKERMAPLNVLMVCIPPSVSHVCSSV